MYKVRIPYNTAKGKIRNKGALAKEPQYSPLDTNWHIADAVRSNNQIRRSKMMEIPSDGDTNSLERVTVSL
jgi:hypothetical protein